MKGGGGEGVGGGVGVFDAKIVKKEKILRFVCVVLIIAEDLLDMNHLGTRIPGNTSTDEIVVFTLFYGNYLSIFIVPSIPIIPYLCLSRHSRRAVDICSLMPPFSRKSVLNLSISLRSK